MRGAQIARRCVRWCAVSRACGLGSLDEAGAAYLVVLIELGVAVGECQVLPAYEVRCTCCVDIVIEVSCDTVEQVSLVGWVWTVIPGHGVVVGELEDMEGT